MTVYYITVDHDDHKTSPVGCGNVWSLCCRYQERMRQTGESTLSLTHINAICLGINLNAFFNKEKRHETS